MTEAKQNLSQTLPQVKIQVKITEKDTIAVTSNANCVCRLLTVFQTLLLFPCFQIKNAWGEQ